MPVDTSPEVTVRLAKATVDLYAVVAERLLATVARRLASGVDRPGWAERKLLQVASLRDETRRLVDQLQTEGPAAVEAAMRQAHQTGLAGGLDDLRAAGVTVPAGSPSPHAVQALVRETVTRVESTHGAILRTAEDMFRGVISEVTGGPVVGGQTRRQAAQTALDRLAMRGVSGFVDRAGRSWDLPSYVEMATRTGVGHAHVQGALDRFAQAGHDLVIVSDAPQECRLCRPFELRVLSQSGRQVGQEVDGRTVMATVAEARGRGLQHPNCRHSMGLFVPGLTREAPAGGTSDPEGDRARRRQREIERSIRQWKQRRAVAITPEAEALAGRKVREWQGAMRGHLGQTGLLRQRPREQIGSGR